MSTLDGRVPAALALSVNTSVGTRIFSGNTMIHGDTGERSWVVPESANMTSGRVVIRRVGDMVFVEFRNCVFSTVTNPAIGIFPPGFRPSMIFPFSLYSGSWPLLDGSGRITYAGYVNLYRVPLNTEVSGTAIFSTTNAWPSSLPGLPI